eukprot:Skav204561  [mRNA]  locus=scaffold2682:116620:140281:+ [translate_table: standard]
MVRPLRGSEASKDINIEEDIFEAAKQGKATVVRYMLRQRKDLVTYKDKMGQTPVEAAKNKGYTDFATLLQEGAKSQEQEDKDAAENYRDRCGSGNIFRAAAEGHIAVVSHLLRCRPGSLRQRGGQQGATPLHYAARCGQGEMCFYLLGQRAQLNAQADTGQTPLHWAAAATAKNREMVVWRLLAAKARTNVKDNDGNSPMDVAHEKGGSSDILDMFKQVNGDLPHASPKEVQAREFPYDEVAKCALFLVSCTTSLDAGRLRQINKEKLESSESDKESSDQESAEKGSEESSSESSSTSSSTCKSQLRRTIAELRGTVQEFEEAIAVHQSIQDENDDLSILVDDLHDENIAFRAEIRQLRAKFEA